MRGPLSDQQLYFVPHRLMWEDNNAADRVEVLTEIRPRASNDLERFARPTPGKLALKGARYRGRDLRCDALRMDEERRQIYACRFCSLDAAGALDFLRQLAPDLNKRVRSLSRDSVLKRQQELALHF